MSPPDAGHPYRFGRPAAVFFRSAAFRPPRKPAPRKELTVKARIVSFHCVLRNKLGQIISSTYNQDVITCDAAKDSPLRPLAQALQDLRKGQKRRVSLPAEH